MAANRAVTPGTELCLPPSMPWGLKVTMLIFPQIIRKQKSRSEQHREEEPEWPLLRDCSAKEEDEGHKAALGDPRVPTALWVSLTAHAEMGPMLMGSEGPHRWGKVGAEEQRECHREQGFLQHPGQERKDHSLGCINQELR